MPTGGRKQGNAPLNTSRAGGEALPARTAARTGDRPEQLGGPVTRDGPDDRSEPVKASTRVPAIEEVTIDRRSPSLRPPDRTSVLNWAGRRSANCVIRETKTMSRGRTFRSHVPADPFQRRISPRRKSFCAAASTTTSTLPIPTPCRCVLHHRPVRPLTVIDSTELDERAATAPSFTLVQQHLAETEEVGSEMRPGSPRSSSAGRTVNGTSSPSSGHSLRPRSGS